METISLYEKSARLYVVTRDQTSSCTMSTNEQKENVGTVEMSETEEFGCSGRSCCISRAEEPHDVSNFWIEV